MNIFTYGTLMDPEIMETVSGGHFNAQKILLKHYRRKKVQGEVYPGIVREEHCLLAGIVYLGVDAQALARLDRFEGPQYARCDVTLSCENGAELGAQAYVIKEEHVFELSDEDWSFEVFLKSGKAKFKADYRGFDELNGSETERSAC